MKRKWLIAASLALVMVAQLALPAAARAAEPQAISGTGTAGITYMPDPIFLSPTVLLFRGEVVEGSIDDANLAGMPGSTLYSVHTSLVQVDWTTGAIHGFMSGSFTLTSPDGSVLEGVMTARQSGNLFGDISSQGRWRATTRTGIFAEMAPFGTWSSVFDVNGAGTLSWNGWLVP